ncbi:FtsX-like permease family protein [Nonomuraea sp. NPDC050328]|uniref:FtsX-like permease family protein n=1 Tax=Nonomuraea sp. NPDC050328 TaxID=3364361 RepID=UPI0037AEC280
MNATLSLAWRLLRGGGRRGLLGTWLTFGAVAVSTALLLFAISANLAFDARAERGAWRNPVAAKSGAVAVQATRLDYVAGRPITVVDIAALGDRAPAPPGLPRVPAPGEVWLSPALRELARELPADRLAARYPEQRGTLGEEALVHPEELVVVAGHRPDDPAMKSRDRDVAMGSVKPTRVASFAGTPTDDAIGYRILALIAGVLMVVPLLVFGGAAARLTVARRDQRLAALRLVGATPAQVAGMTVAEAMLVALAGALAGTVLYGLAAPLLTRIEIGGGPWYTADLWPPVWIVAVALAGVPVLVGLSAVAGLRRVVVSPLGVAKRETPPGLRFVRVLVLLAALIAVPVLSRQAGVAVIAGALGLAFLSLNLVGPWVVAVIGRVTAARARRPGTLLAGRRLVDDPRSAWRTVSGVALTGFVAGFLGLLSPSADLLGSPDRHQLTLAVPVGQAEKAAAEARERLAVAGVRAEVETTKGGIVAALGTGADQAVTDRARTALEGLAPGHTATTEAEDGSTSAQVLKDVGTGTVVVLAVSFLVAIASAGITAASSVLDRRQTYALLRLAGTPLEVLDRARRSETLIPLAVMGGGSIATGVLCALPFMYAAMNVRGVLTLVTCVVLGFGGVLAAGALSRPLLRSVTADPAPRPD